MFTSSPVAWAVSARFWPITWAVPIQARLALCARSAFPEKTEWERWLSEHSEPDPVSQKIRTLQAVEAQGAEVLVIQADVTVETQMRQAVEMTIRRFGALHGVIYAAGISAREAFDSVQEIRPEQCEMHFQPKADGLYVLQSVLEGRPLDFCLLFSSISSVLGGLGFAGYTAANIFIDTFTHWHNRRSQTPWLSVNWDTWRARGNHRDTTGRTVVAYEMTPHEGAQALERVLMHRSATQLINSTGDLQTRIRQWIELEILHDPAPLRAAGAPPELTTHYVVGSTHYERTVAAVWQKLLGIERIGVHDNFFDLGGNSLIGLQVIAALKKELGLQIPVVALFEAPTVSTLARYLSPNPQPAEDDQSVILAERRKGAHLTGTERNSHRRDGLPLSRSQ